jgi:RNA polymerase sigma-70 factor (ECF subfamily)
VHTLEQFSQLFSHYRHTLARAAARIVKPHDVEDVVQETYLRIYQAAQKQPIQHPRAFMLTTARNIAINLATRADALNYTTDTSPENSFELLDAAADSCEARAVADEEFLLFCRAVRELPSQCRKAFVLKRVYGLSQREVAAELAITEGAVEKLLARGLAACCRFMAARDYPQQQQRRAPRVRS